MAARSGYSTRQIRAITKRYNEGGLEALGDQRRRNGGRKSLLDAAGQAELVLALSRPPPDGGVWTGRKIAAWIACKTGQAVSAKRGWAHLARIRSAARNSAGRASARSRGMSRPDHLAPTVAHPTQQVER